VNADYALKKQIADSKLVPEEQKTAKAGAEGKVIYRTITRNVVTHGRKPDRTRCDFDDARLRQQDIDAANYIPGFDDAAMPAKSGGK